VVFLSHFLLLSVVCSPPLARLGGILGNFGFWGMTSENLRFVDFWLKIFLLVFLLYARKGITFVPIKEIQTDDDATTSHISEPKAG
jgi:hypothetical protein